jgi:hypothetical protein
MKQFTLFDAEQALEENLTHFSKEHHVGLHNMTIGLLGICSELKKLREDVERTRNMVQPILKEISNDRFPDVGTYRSPRP